MKVRDLTNKCGLVGTEFRFCEGIKSICNATAADLRDEDKYGELMNRTVNTFRVENNSLRVFLKF